MLTKTEALELVRKRLEERGWKKEPCKIVDEGTIEKSFGWVFFYNTKKYLETGQIRYALAGNGPVIVNKNTGNVEFFGTNKPPLEIVAEYERKLAGGNQP